MRIFKFYSKNWYYIGGFNIAVSGEKEASDRYPLNRKSCFLVNIVGAYPFYILAVIFPYLIWLGLAQILFGMAQVFFHGILVNVKMKSIYKDGSVEWSKYETTSHITDS
jgi:hypothetical protein